MDATSPTVVVVLAVCQLPLLVPPGFPHNGAGVYAV
jgi:hypothetical protein